MDLLTLFTAPKPFTDPHIRIIQRNTLKNWLALGDAVDVIVIGDEPGIAETCKELGIRHIPDVRCNDLGTPLISSIFGLAREKSSSPYLVYSNADILFLPDLVHTVRALEKVKDRFLAIGQRWDLDVDSPIDFANGWDDELAQRVREQAQLHGQTGSDYFIYPKACFTHIPDFAVGRAGWDNWMIYHARWQNWPVIDLTQTVTVVHQNHDYAHLPGGIIHFRQPETDQNVRIGGGRRTIFTLEDATHYLQDDKLQKAPRNWRSFWREVEIFPLVRLHSRLLGWFAFAFFHPVRAFREVRGWLAYKLGQL